jgi:hypothetical protein
MTFYPVLRPAVTGNFFFLLAGAFFTFLSTAESPEISFFLSPMRIFA